MYNKNEGGNRTNKASQVDAQSHLQSDESTLTGDILPAQPNAAASQAVATSPSPNLADAARWYFDQGFNVIPIASDKGPVTAKPGGKKRLEWDPLKLNRQTPDEFNKLPWYRAAGIAVITGEVSVGLACIDFDDQPDRNAVDALLAKGNLPADCTWVVITPGGGYHVYVLVPGLDLGGKGILDRKGIGGGHIELRYTGHLAALPPSLHENGGRYEFVNGVTPSGPPATVSPEILLSAYDAVTEVKKPPVATPKQPARQTQTTGASPKHGEAYARAAFDNEVANVRSAVEGNRNTQLNNSAFALGQLVGGGGLDRSEVERALTDAALAIGLSEEETRATIKSGLEGGMAQPRTIPAPQNEKRGEHASDSRISNEGLIDDESSSDLDDVWADHPQAKVPRYAMDSEGCMVYQKENGKWVRIADYTAVITEVIIAEDGTANYRLKGRTRFGNQFDITIPAGDMEDSRILKKSLSTATGPRAAIHSHMPNHLAPAIHALTGDTRQTWHYDRPGWIDSHTFLIPGREPEGVHITTAQKLPYRIDPQASLDEGLDGLEYAIRSIGAKNSLPIVVAVFEAPMAYHAGWRNERYLTFVQGGTGLFKTSSGQVYMAIYGPDFAGNDDLLIKLGDGATMGAIMANAAQARDMPILLDNYKPNIGKNGVDIYSLIHHIVEGGDKDRLTQDAELRRTKSVSAWPIVTGEDFPDKDPASLARVLLVRVENLPADASELLSVAQRKAHHLNAVGNEWLSYLESEEGQHAVRTARGRYDELRHAYSTRLREIRRETPNVWRIASNLASNHITWEVLCGQPNLGPLFKRYASQYLAAMETMTKTMAGSTTSSQIAERFKHSIRELLANGQCVLIQYGTPVPKEDRGRVLGYPSPDGGVYLFPESARKAVERLSGAEALGDISPTTLYRQLADLGYIASQNKDDGYTKTISVGQGDEKHSVRVLHLTPKFLRDD